MEMNLSKGLLVVWLVLVPFIKESDSTDNLHEGRDCEVYSSATRAFSSFPTFVGIRPLVQKWEYELDFKHKTDRIKNFVLKFTNDVSTGNSIMGGEGHIFALNWQEDLYKANLWSYFLIYQEKGNLYISDRQAGTQTGVDHQIENIQNQDIETIQMQTKGAEFQVNCHEGCPIKIVSGEFYPNTHAAFELQPLNRYGAIEGDNQRKFDVNNTAWYSKEHILNSLNNSTQLTFRGLFLMKICAPVTTAMPTTTTTKSTSTTNPITTAKPTNTRKPAAKAGCSTINNTARGLSIIVVSAVVVTITSLMFGYH